TIIWPVSTGCNPRSVSSCKRLPRERIPPPMRPLDDFLQKPGYELLVGADHGGLEIKQALIGHLRARGVNVRDAGPCSLDPADDYPDFAGIVSRAISHGSADAGILICRTGIGMSINANRFHYVRAALATRPELAR